MKISNYAAVLFFVAALYTQNGISQGDDSESGEGRRRTPYCKNIKKRCPGGLPTGRVCGSNGRTYKNTCSLQRADCKSPMTITVSYAGPCKKKPTTGGASGMSKQCQRVIRRCPTKFLKGTCCGSNDVTYPNECELHRTRCRQGMSLRQLRVVHQGPCIVQVPTEPPATTRPQTTTPDPCLRHCGIDERSSFVCGSDGVTYLSACHLEKTACIAGKTITVVHSGLCRPTTKPGEPRPPSKPHAPSVPKHEKTTVIPTPKAPTTGAPTAKVPVTNPPSTKRPTTKPLATKPRTTKAATTTVAVGTAKPNCIIDGTRVQCDDGTVPTDPPQCPTSCDVTIDTKPVCGSDGKTYKTKCHLHMEACTAGLPTLIVEYVGECVEAGGQGADCDFCPGTMYAPVCGTDAISYYNECELRKYACYISDPTLQVAHGGVCREIPPPPPISPDCPNRCPLTIDPVCGTNGRTYKSICLLKSAACELGDPTLTVAYIGECMVPTTRDPCLRDCPTQYNPVCGSDWTTYLNACFFSIAACRDPSLQKIHPGTCRMTIRSQLHR